MNSTLPLFNLLSILNFLCKSDVLCANTQEYSPFGYQFYEANKGALRNSNWVSAYLYTIKANFLDLMFLYKKNSEGSSKCWR